MKNRLLSIILVICIVIALAPATAFAEGETEYDLWVGHIRVTNGNKDDVFGPEDGDGATVTYDPDTQTLTLNNATITTSNMADGYHYNSIFAKATINKLTIRLIGTNSVTSTDNSKFNNSVGICTAKSLEIIGDGSLTAVGKYGRLSYGIYTATGLSIDCGAVTAIAGDADLVSYGINGRVTIKSGTVTAISGTASTASSAFSQAPAFDKDYSPEVTAGLDESTASLVEYPNSNTYTTSKYVKIQPIKSNQTIVFAETAIEKTYGDPSFTITADLTYGDGTITYTSDNTDVVTVDNSDGKGEVTINGVGTATITAAASETKHYWAAAATCTITVVKGTPTAADLDCELTDVTYDGNPKAVIVSKKTAEIGDITVKYNDSATPPVNAGTYTITADIEENDEYVSASSLYLGEFTIAKAAITITAMDKSAYVGDPVPVLGESDYTVTGLVNGETLRTEPVLTYEETPDMTREGTAAITVSGAEAPEGDNYNEIIYQDGVLTISSRPGSGETGETGETGGTGGSGETGGTGGSGETGETGGTGETGETGGTGRGSNGSTTSTASNIPPAPVTEVKNGESITASNIDRLISSGNNLTVKADGGATLVFDTDALKGIDDQISGQIKVEVRDVSNEYKETHSGKLVFSLTVSSGNGTISDFGGKVTIFLPYDLKEGERAEDVTVWYLSNDGAMTEIPCTYDPVTKLASFTVTHFSLYVVGVADKPWINPFSDVAQSDWFYDAVMFVNQSGLFAGTGVAAFSPHDPMTRAMLWTALGRLDGQNLSGSGAFEKARIWAMDAGITDGTNPDSNITREQMVTILWRYAGAPRAEGDLGRFSDADKVSGYAIDTMAWAVENGIINGTSGKLMPQDNATRAQVAAIMQRFIGITAK